MVQPAWELYLSDLSGNTLADLTDAWGKQFTFIDGAAATVSFDLPLNHAHAAKVAAGTTLLIAYRTPVNGTKAVRFHGTCWNVEARGSDGMDMLNCTFADPMAVLSARHTTTTFNSTALGTIIKTLVDNANSDNDTRIATDASWIQSSPVHTVNWADTRKPVGEAIQEFAELLDGVGVELRPTEYAAGKISQLFVYSPKGSVQDSALFAYGASTVSNLTSVTYSTSMAGMANHVVAYGDANISSTKTDATSIATYGRMEANLNFSDITNTTHLGAAAQEWLGDNSTPVVTVTLNAALNAPRVFDDYVPGDTVRVHGSKGAMDFVENVRVVSVTLDVDDLGREVSSSVEGVKV